ncbi:MAG: carboxypeptidase regulatory-like domain-containing protein [Ideonella sp.]|nr:carboxypeptidase regulatory-like domain-containing protein [Ideonella sp.]
MKKWNLVIDIAKCFNCNNCTLACHDEYHDNEFPGVAHGMPKQGQNWFRIAQRETGAVPVVEVSYLPTTCNHCDNAPCVAAGRDGAVVKRADGIVIIVPEKARGQRQIVDACPYGAVHWNEERQLPQAWPFDAHLLDAGWTRTRGAQACPTQAMQVLHVEDEEMRRLVEAEKLEVLNPEFGAAPRVYYRNLKRFRSVFIAGQVAAQAGGVVDCVEGATVTLESRGRMVATVRTDAYGDFRFSGLDVDSGPYRVGIVDPRYATETREVELRRDSVDLGCIALRPRAGAQPQPGVRSAEAASIN